MRKSKEKNMFIKWFLLCIVTAFLVIIGCKTSDESSTIQKLINEIPQHSLKMMHLGRLSFCVDGDIIEKIVVFGEKATPVLLKNLKRDDPAIITGCLECIKRIGDVSCIPVLEKELAKYKEEKSKIDKDYIPPLIYFIEETLDSLRGKSRSESNQGK